MAAPPKHSNRIVACDIRKMDKRPFECVNAYTREISSDLFMLVSGLSLTNCCYNEQCNASIYKSTSFTTSNSPQHFTLLAPYCEWVFKFDS